VLAAEPLRLAFRKRRASNALADEKGRHAIAAELAEMVEVLLRAQAMVTDITARALLGLPNEPREVAEAKHLDEVS
jgi:hypothetical protein